ncbi:MAG: mannitol 2-dehydrogenase [Solirubrobacteraceae bacterium]
MVWSASVSVGQAHLAEIARRGVPVPLYDRGRLAPRIVHVGVGGFHRAHLAVYAQELASDGGDWGIVGLGLLEHDARMAAALRAQDHLYTLIEKGGGAPTAEVIGSIIGYVHAPDDGDGAVAELVASPATSILSLTVTEAGYSEPSAERAASGAGATFDRLAAALAVRRSRAAGPLTILSCDNLPGNGDAARLATLAAAARADALLPAWVEANCTFPNSMVDRITPVTAEADRDWLHDAAGIDDRWPVVCEPFRQWVMEDDFAGGRPPWEEVGAVFTDRIHDWELYKLRLLNAGHSCIAYLSALAGVTFVHEAMAVPATRAFLEELLQREAMPTLDEIPGHPREQYVATVLDRFSNPGVHDQIARVCVDGSAKFPKFLIPTIARQLEVNGPIERATTALASWARYLAVVEPADQAFDSNADAARRHAADAVADPVAFLEFDPVFPSAMQGSQRFREEFAGAYRRIVERGPIAAMEPDPELEPT